MDLPRLTHLQFIVLGMLFNEERSGDSIRTSLKGNAVRQTGPAFYQMMARLEDAGWVQGWYAKNEVDGYIFKERRYRITEPGRDAWQATRDFYQEAVRLVEGREIVADA